MFRRIGKRVLTFILLLIVFIYLNNSSIFISSDQKKPFLLAHRGVAQTFPMEGITGDTCTAEKIFKPQHTYIENTIPSMEAAFKAGADIVELDVQPTLDGEFAVFHDWTLDCRTNGTGVTREHTMEELKLLDIGYGYTADSGKTYPLRGKGAGLMPTLNEVLEHFPEQSLLIHIKSNDPLEGEKLADYLSMQGDSRPRNLSVYGGNDPIASLKENLPEMRVMSVETMKSCLIPYLTVGWTGYVPSSCENTQLHIPEKYAPFLWGFPGRFVDRMERANTTVILVAGDGGWSEGFDDQQDLQRISKKYDGGIWTNRIDLIGQMVKEE